MPELRQPLAPPPAEGAEPGDDLRRALDLLGERALGWHSYRGDDTLLVARDSWAEAHERLRSDAALRYDRLMDLSAVDGLRLDWRPRFQLVTHLYSIPRNRRLRVKTPIDERDATAPSLAGLWAGADWFEREVFDMFGIRFEGHPDLRRILMYDEFEGHPLRKDYPMAKRQPLVGPPSPARTPWREGVWPAQPTGLLQLKNVAKPEGGGGKGRR